jgi:hypothetical protein
MPHLVALPELDYKSSMRSLLAISLLVTCASCGPRPPPPGYARDDVHAFVREHRAALQQEAKIGSGPTLRDLGILAGCQNQPELARRLHKDHDEIFAAPADAEVAERVIASLKKTRELRCLNLELSREREFSAGLRHIGPRRSVSR